MRPECTHCRERFSDYLDGLLNAAGRADADAHLAVCPDCRRELELWKAVLQGVAALPREGTPDGFGARVMARLEAESRPQEGLQVEAPRQRPLLLGLWLRALPVAAMVLLVFGAVAIVQHSAMVTPPERSLAMAPMPAPPAATPPVAQEAGSALAYSGAGSPASAAPAARMALKPTAPSDAEGLFDEKAKDAVDMLRLKDQLGQSVSRMATEAAAGPAGGELVFQQTQFVPHAVASPEQTLTLYAVDPADLIRRAIEVANRQGMEVTLVFRPDGRADISIQVPAAHYEPLVAALSDLTAPQSQTLSNSALAKGAFFRRSLDKYNASNQLRMEQQTETRGARMGAAMAAGTARRAAEADTGRAAGMTAALNAPREAAAAAPRAEPSAAQKEEKPEPAPAVVNLQVTIQRAPGQ
jgi:anti-sigma factor RsiW